MVLLIKILANPQLRRDRLVSRSGCLQHPGATTRELGTYQTKLPPICTYIHSYCKRHYTRFIAEIYFTTYVFFHPMSKIVMIPKKFNIFCIAIKTSQLPLSRTKIVLKNKKKLHKKCFYRSIKNFSLNKTTVQNHNGSVKEINQSTHNVPKDVTGETNVLHKLWAKQ